MLQRFALIFRSELGFKIIYVIPPIANADVATAATVLRQNLFLSCIPKNTPPTPHCLIIESSNNLFQ